MMLTREGQEDLFRVTENRVVEQRHGGRLPRKLGDEQRNLIVPRKFAALHGPPNEHKLFTTKHLEKSAKRGITNA